MKFLSKKEQSVILEQNITYRKNAQESNKHLKESLMLEQFNFCAYTEKYLGLLDSIEVEHFDSSKKYYDNYYNYYAVIRNANLYKQDEKYRGASFFDSLFFQNEEELEQRIGFTNNIYYEKDENDSEARDFIDFLNLNHPTLSQHRSNHVKRLQEIFQSAKYNLDDIKNYFSTHKEELSHITAIEDALQLQLIDLVRN